MNRSFLWFVPAITFLLGIFALSTFLPIPTQIEVTNHSDKIKHVSAYTVLTLSFFVAFYKTGVFTVMTTVITLPSLAGYGILIELLQHYFFENRHFEWYDIIANTIGIVIGFFITRRLVHNEGSR